MFTQKSRSRQLNPSRSSNAKAVKQSHQLQPKLQHNHKAPPKQNVPSTFALHPPSSGHLCSNVPQTSQMQSQIEVSLPRHQMPPMRQTLFMSARRRMESSWLVINLVVAGSMNHIFAPITRRRKDKWITIISQGNIQVRWKIPRTLTTGPSLTIPGHPQVSQHLLRCHHLFLVRKIQVRQTISITVCLSGSVNMLGYLQVSQSLFRCHQLMLRALPLIKECVPAVPENIRSLGIYSHHCHQLYRGKPIVETRGSCRSRTVTLKVVQQLLVPSETRSWIL